MPRPVLEHFFVPVTASYMAAEAYMRSEAMPEQSFADFFTANHLNTRQGYDRFYSAATVVQNAGLVQPGTTVDDYLDYLRIEPWFDRLLIGALVDAEKTYKSAVLLLTQQRLKEPRIDISSIVPMLQNSKRFAHQIGLVPTVVGIVALVDSALSMQWAAKGSPAEPILQWQAGKDDPIGKIDFTPHGYNKHIRPHLSPTNGCPLLSMFVEYPESTPSPGGGESYHPRVRVYDLYWDALIAQVHNNLMKNAL